MGGIELNCNRDTLIPVCSHLWDPKRAIQSSDSDVFRLGDACLKLYYIDPELVRLYGIMQSLLWGYEGREELKNPVPASVFFWEWKCVTSHTVNSIRFSCIKILPEIIETPPAYNWSGVTTTVKLPFIEWKTLHDVFWKVANNRAIVETVFGKWLMAQVQRFYSRLWVDLSHHFSHSNQIAGINIKAISFNEESAELQLLITDIAADIQLFVRRNEHLLQ